MLDLISIGSISIDLYFKGDSLTADKERFHLAVGGKYVVDHLYESVGGGGANVAIGGVKNGLQAGVLGIVGNNSFKQIILDELVNSNVSTHLCQFQNNYLNISSILLTKNGDRSIIHYEPPNEHIFSSLDNFKHLLIAKAFYFGNLADVPLSERGKAVSFLKENKVFIFMNLGVKDCRKDKDHTEKLIKNIDVLILNGHEFADLVKRDYADIDFEKNVINDIEILADKVVVVTDGEKGSHGYADGRACHKPAIKIEKIVDATGAGDGYTCAFIAEYLKTKDLEKAMEAGTRYAAKILGQIGAN